MSHTAKGMTRPWAYIPMFMLAWSVLWVVRTLTYSSHATAKCPWFVSWGPAIGTCVVDAFTITSGSNNYAFPPFLPIVWVLWKLVADIAEAIQVVPELPA